MNQEKLKTDLEALHEELKQTQTIDRDQRQLLQTLSSDIHKLLTQLEQDDSSEGSGLAKKLAEAVAQLEASHPRVTLLMREVIDSLAYLGV